jgi:hypothetical protein
MFDKFFTGMNKRIKTDPDDERKKITLPPQKTRDQCQSM